MEVKKDGKTAHPLEALMESAMQGIKGMADVNMVVGDPVETNDGTLIIPVSQVSCGFVAGGGEYQMPDHAAKQDLPFAGGSGAGVSVKPVGFLVCRPGEVRLITVGDNHLAERLVDLAPQVLDKIESLFQKKCGNQESQPDTA